MQSVFVARQPIYDRSLTVIGYELLFRAAEADRADVADGDLATSQVILNAFTVIGLDQLVGSAKAFINLTRSFLVQEHRIPFPRERVVLEILEDIDPDPQLIDALREIKSQGYAIALDDFEYSSELLPLLRVADIVKLDVQSLAGDRLAKQVRTLRRHPVKLVAEKVETRSEFDVCLGLGFDYFQGYFLSRPDTVRSTSIPSGRLSTMNLLAALNRADVQIDELERLIAQDVSLSYKLLRYLNSAFFTTRRKIASIHQAIVYLGLEALRSWASLLVMATVPGKPRELVVTLMVRAKMCELLATAARLPAPGSCFTVGLFSGLDALFDAPLERILAGLPLSDETTAALLRHEGEQGRLLQYVLRYEKGDWESIVEQPLAAETVINAYVAAVAWANQVASSWS